MILTTIFKLFLQALLEGISKMVCLHEKQSGDEKDIFKV